jgi:hypothetical protein
MPYIGNQPAESFTSFATQEFSTSATTSYTLDHAVTNENEIALFINNVRQQPGSGKAYTATGTALTLSAATASTDTMYCVFLGRALQTVTPATNSITSSMVTSSFPLGITVADQLRITANITSNTNPISANIERVDGTAQGGMTDNQMSVSSGIFTFPLTGIYLVAFAAASVPTSGGDNIAIEINATTDNSSYSQIAYSATGGDNRNQQNYCQSLIDVTDTSNVKVKFSCSSIDSGSVIYGGTNINYTYFTFIRLGDT